MLTEESKAEEVLDQKQNEAATLNELGNFYLFKDESQAYNYYEQAVALDYPKAMVNLAQLLLVDSEHWKKDIPKAKALLEKAIEAKYYGAFYILAELAQDDDEKMELYSKATELGFSEAYYNAGMVYFQQGNDEEGLKYWLIGAEKNSAKCCYNLGLYYAQKKEFNKALYYIKLSKQNGYLDSTNLATVLLLKNFLQTNYQKYRQVNFWTQKDGVSNLTFKAVWRRTNSTDQLLNGELLILEPLVPNLHNIITISLYGIIKSLDYWQDYKSGVITLENFKKAYANYIVSILHEMEMQIGEL